MRLYSLTAGQRSDERIWSSRQGSQICYKYQRRSQRILTRKKHTDNVTVNEAVIMATVKHPFKDFEDAMQYHTAMADNADCIVTRNKKDFTGTEIPVMEPQEFLDMLAE